MTSEPLATKIIDFLSLMEKCYQKEMEEQTSKIQELDDEEKRYCDNCNSAICKMVQNGNPGLECWHVYAQDPKEIYKYWFSGKVLPEINKHES